MTRRSRRRIREGPQGAGYTDAGGGPSLDEPDQEDEYVVVEADGHQFLVPRAHIVTDEGFPSQRTGKPFKQLSTVIRGTGSNKLVHASPEQRAGAITAAADLTAEFYLGSGNAVAALELVAAIDRLFKQVGARETLIHDIEEGSIRARIAAWLDDGQTREAARARISEAAAYAEQWAKDAAVNETRSRINKNNAEAFAHLMDSIRDEDRAAVRVGQLLILRYVGVDGKRVTMMEELSLEQMRVLEKFSAMLSEPHLVMKNLAFLIEQQNQAQVAEG